MALINVIRMLLWFVKVVARPLADLPQRTLLAKSKRFLHSSTKRSRLASKQCFLFRCRDRSEGSFNMLQAPHPSLINGVN